MKRIILVGALALLAACGGSDGVSVATTSGGSATTVAGGSASTTPSSDDATSDTSLAVPDDSSDVTVPIGSLSDAPKACLDLLSAYLKKIEPVVSAVDWKNATVGELDALGDQFSTESDSFDAASTAAGCDKYDITGSDADTFPQILAFAEKEAPGTLPFLNFVYSMTQAGSGSGDASGSLPADCAGTIAAIEPYISSGKKMTELTVTELTQLQGLIGGVSTKCSAEEASAFFARADLQAFISG